nr:ATP-binding protein [uncultured Tolumonas sp.]
MMLHRQRASKWIQSSLRRRLLIWLLPATFIAGVIASMGAYWGAFFELEELLNEQMRYIVTHANVDDNHHISLNKISHTSSIDEDKVVFQVWRGDHLEYTTAPAITLPSPQGTGWHDLPYADMTWHTFVDKRGELLVRVAQPQNVRWETLAGLSVQLFWPVLSLIPILAIVLWFGIGNGLKPLKRIASELETRNVDSMAAINADTLPDEIKPLIESLNSLFLRLEQSFTMQKHFIADAAHELRTPVMAISLQSELIRNAGNTQEREQATQQLQNGILRLTHLIQQLLTLARLEPDGQSVVQEKFDVSTLCKSVILEKYILAKKKQIDLGFVSDEVAEINGDPHMLRILLNNLVDNAIRYTPEHGRIDISACRQKEFIEVSVRDNGPGIPAEERDRIFDRFVRGNEHQDVQGTGLGLSIVKRIAERHQATIELSDTENGKGLNVCVKFPV